MHKKGKIAWVVAATAAAAMITAGAVSAASNSAATTVNRAATSDVRALLLPTQGHPAAGLIDFEVNLQQATTSSLPAGMVYSSKSCEPGGQLAAAIPNLSSLNGWMRATDRGSKTFSHSNFYLDMVASVPGGADLDKIREAASLCKTGTLTLDGKVTGTVSYTEVKAPALQGAKTLSMSIQVKFNAPKDATEAAILTKYGYGTTSTQGAGVDATKQVEFVGTGETLFMVLSPSPTFADDMAVAFNQRALAAGIR